MKGAGGGCPLPLTSGKLWSCSAGQVPGTYLFFWANFAKRSRALCSTAMWYLSCLCQMCGIFWYSLQGLGRAPGGEIEATDNLWRLDSLQFIYFGLVHTESPVAQLHFRDSFLAAVCPYESFCYHKSQISTFMAWLLWPKRSYLLFNLLRIFLIKMDSFQAPYVWL